MPEVLKNYQPANLSLWQGRADALPNEYYFQVVKSLDLNQLNTRKSGFAILSFACDEGISRNLGRPGAKMGPQVLKQYLAKLPLHRSLEIYDAGTISCDNTDLET